MDLHERLMKLPTAGSAVFEILASEEEKNAARIFHELHRSCNEKVYDGTANYEILELYRIILSYVYRALINNLDGKENNTRNKEICISEFNDYAIVEIGKYFRNDTTSGYRESEEFFILRDIVSLKLALSSDVRNAAHSLKIFCAAPKEDETSRDEKNLHVIVCECFVDSCILRSRLCKKADKREEIARNATEAHNFVIDVVRSWMKGSDKKDWRSLASILPKLLAIFDARDTILPLWNDVILNRYDPDETLSVLCTIADAGFLSKGKDALATLSECCEREQFWRIVLCGLESTIHQRRKFALYLFESARRLTISRARVAASGARSDGLQEILLPFVPMDALANKRESSTDSIENNFRLVLESLEEKQKHLILPALTRLPHLVEAYSQRRERGYTFHAAWLRCVFKRILGHDSVDVKLLGLRKILEADLDIVDEEFMDFIVNALNDIRLYEYNEKENSDNKPEIVTLLTKFLIRSDEARGPTIGILVRALSQKSWCPVAIYWILRALVAAGEDRSIVGGTWTTRELYCVKDLLEKNLTKHYKILRINSQSLILRALHEYLRKEFLSLTDVELVIDIVAGTCASSDSSDLYEDGVRLLGKIVKDPEARSYVAHMCKVSLEQRTIDGFARMIILLAESNLILNAKDCYAERALRGLMDNTIGADMRPYADSNLILGATELASRLIIHSHRDRARRDTSIVRLVSRYRDALSRRVERGLVREKTASSELEINLVAIRALASLDDASELKNFRKKCLRVLVEAPSQDAGQWLYALGALRVCDEINDFRETEAEETLLLRLLFGHFRDAITIASFDKRGRNVWDSCDDAAALARRCIERIESLEFLRQLEAVNWLRELSFLLRTGDERVVAPLVATLRRLLPLIAATSSDDTNDAESVQSITSLAQRSIFRSARNEAFFAAAKELARLVLDANFQRLTGGERFAAEYADQLMTEGKNVPSLRNILIEELSRLPVTEAIRYRTILVSCLLDGQVPRLDRRIERMTLACCKHGIDKTPIDVNCEIRARSIIALISLSNDTAFSANILNDVVTILKKYRNKRYFDNSHLHRLKHRAMQVLLLLEPRLNRAERIFLRDSIGDLLIGESNQPSVRLMQEWLLVKIYANSTIDESIWKLFDSAIEKRPGSVVSLAGIVYHLSRFLEDAAKNEFIGKAITYLLPNCMSQQFNVRLYSQTILVKMYEMLSDNCRMRYKMIYEGVQESLRRGNLMKNSLKLKDDFYFTIFHPHRDYNFEIIYHQLPRLTGLPIDEWIEFSIFLALGYDEDRGAIRVRGTDDEIDWATLKPVIQSSRATGDTVEETETIVDGGLDDIQKKIIPWKSTRPFTDEYLEISKIASTRMDASGGKADETVMGLIVVASFIDRPPNLGGLARTCEIFGAKELVIGSLGYVNDREFQTLSVSAEKWITITEVKPHLVKNYLLEQRAKGWKLVGAEQTANSVNLREMIFDEKTILILGNEKDGIPASLIPLLDSCVEIQQYGVVRSLNVHVTGAICIWQYAKQHARIGSRNDSIASA